LTAADKTADLGEPDQVPECATASPRLFRNVKVPGIRVNLVLQPGDSVSEPFRFHQRR
jgi:hypothetical protein